MLYVVQKMTIVQGVAGCPFAVPFAMQGKTCFYHVTQVIYVCEAADDGEYPITGDVIGYHHYLDLISERVTRLREKLLAVRAPCGWTLQRPAMLSVSLEQCTQTIVLKICV